MNERPSQRRSVSAGALSTAFCAAACLLLVAGRLHAGVERLDSAQRPVELRPYRSYVSIAFAPGPVLSTPTRRRVVAELEAAVSRSFGATWKLLEQTSAGGASYPVAENDWLAAPLRKSLERLTPGQLKQRVDVEKYDKVLLLTVSDVGSMFEVSGREWDTTVGEFGQVVSVESVRRADLADTGLRVLRRVFSLLAVIEEVDGAQASLRLQGAELGPARLRVTPGTVFRPLLRFHDARSGAVLRTHAIPWTYLTVESVRRARCECRLITGIRAPLGQKQARRTERLALAVQPAFSESRMQFFKGPEESRLAVGYRVSVDPLPAVVDESDDQRQPDPLRLITDRRGSVAVPVNRDAPLVIVTVRNGAFRVARVPLVPGFMPKADLHLPDDSLRLRVEGQLSLLEGDLIDTVAERALLANRARIAARAGNLKDADALLKTLQKLPGLKYHSARLKAIRVNATQQAIEQNDRVARAHVNRQCDKLLGIVRQYLSDERLADVKNEIAELRQIAAEEANEQDEPDSSSNQR